MSPPLLAAPHQRIAVRPCTALLWPGLLCPGPFSLAACSTTVCRRCPGQASARTIPRIPAFTAGGSFGHAISSARQSLPSCERTRRRGTAKPSSPAPTAMPMMACCSASGKAAAPHPPARSAAPTASINRRMRLFGVIAARIPSALIRAPLPAYEKPRRGLEGGDAQPLGGGIRTRILLDAAT